MKSKMTIFSIVIFLGVWSLSVKAQTNKSSNQVLFTYDLCEAEFGNCKNKCSVQLIKGDRVDIGSYIKVFFGSELLTEGYILKHESGSVFILKDKNQAQDPDVCGGCCGEAYEIRIAAKEIWGC